MSNSFRRTLAKTLPLDVLAIVAFFYVWGVVGAAIFAVLLAVGTVVGFFLRRSREDARQRERAANGSGEWLSADDVAELLGVPVKFVWSAVTRNDLPHEKTGRWGYWPDDFRFARADVEAWIARNEKSRASSDPRQL